MVKEKTSKDERRMIYNGLRQLSFQKGNNLFNVETNDMCL